MMGFCLQLQVINQGAKSLRRADQVLVEELQPLDSWTVRHETVELVGVGGVDLRQGRVSLRRRNVLANAPHARVSGVLVLIGQEEIVQELGALGVRGVFKNGASLAPGDEEAILGDGDVQGGGGSHADTAAEGCGIAVVGLADECHRSTGAADPARSLCEKLLEPAKAVLLKAVVLWLVSMSRFYPGALGLNSRQVEGEKNGVVVVWISED